MLLTLVLTYLEDYAAAVAILLFSLLLLKVISHCSHQRFCIQAKSVYSLLFFLASSWLILLLDIFLGPPSTCNALSFPLSQVFSLFKLNLQIGLHMLLLFSNFNVHGCPFLSPTTTFWLCGSEVGPRNLIFHKASPFPIPPRILCGINCFFGSQIEK